MDKEIIIDKTKEYVKNKLKKEATGHDWWHTLRVYRTAKYIGEKENADLFIVGLAALLHDIADWKFNKDNVDLGAELSEQWLKDLKVQEDVINKVAKIIRTMSFKGGTTNSNQESIEGKVVQDADRLDAIGAVGIARTFAYGGFKGREIYNPDIKPMVYGSFEEYKNSEDTTINHFYEKLLLLKDLMNTKTGKSIAEERHKFMENYLEQFLKEWNM
ncbi:HD domain-containing protein [Clostridium sp. P21]|uniref:HD domain-containing protein n=1 Tax=Clostridium muellerianum TaxID=2716538 RepID=A0A7Y0EG39_9CLOT|nr:HD domain-containing protein [Clostridium muellerianum]NMM62844.1 HD domain-containing protein [Clostridium muellerianum]